MELPGVSAEHESEPVLEHEPEPEHGLVPVLVPVLVPEPGLEIGFVLLIGTVYVIVLGRVLDLEGMNVWSDRQC